MPSARWDRAHLCQFDMADGARIALPYPDFDEPGETLDYGRLRLSRLEAALAGFHLDHQAEAATTQIGWLHVAGRRLERYEAAAARIGSRNWQPVVAMAESALGAGRQDVAVTVHRAADQPGFHQSHLRQRCLQLTGVDLATNRELRIVR